MKRGKLKRMQKVMVYGTFDVLHPGHLNFLRQAKKLGDFLIVSVARDVNAKKFKGFYPVFSERERLEIIKSLKMVDKAVLGDSGYYLKHTLRENPDIIALGHDQHAYEKHLRRDVDQGKLKAKIVRLKPYKAKRFKSTIYKQLIKKA